MSELVLTSKEWFTVIRIEPLEGQGCVRLTVDGDAKVTVTLTAAAAEDMGQWLAMQGANARV